METLLLINTIALTVVFVLLIVVGVLILLIIKQKDKEIAILKSKNEWQKKELEKRSNVDFDDFVKHNYK